MVDATCPDVKKIHRVMEQTEGEGQQVVMIGKRDHPEVIAACGWCENAVVLENAGELDAWLSHVENRQRPLALTFQTTIARENVEQCQEILKKWCTSAQIFDTICDATSKRQAEARQLSATSDAMIVIGDRDSANSRNLAAICEKHCNHVVFVEDAAGLSLHRFDEADAIGIIAGASTPAWIIKEVYQTMSDEILKDVDLPELVLTQPEAEATSMAPEVEAEVEAAIEATSEAPAITEEEDSFEALLEKSIKTLHTGEKVVGIVTAISPTEISVDLGTKQAAYIPTHELSDDPDVAVEDIVQIGKEVEAYVMRVNDVEGLVVLSKKRLDTVKYWEQIEKAIETKAILEGTVTEENKGGVVVRVKGIRVFVPASQTGIPKGEPMDQLMGQKVKLRISEVNQSRRRVVGSIRAVGSELRREQAEKVWSEIEVGKRYAGVVKSLAAYGAFVDIGGVDGMVHVSELSWNRVKSPADVLKVGDPLDVYVISFDKEKGRISLGHKDPSQNPWKNFTDKYEKGSTAEVKIVKLMPFGAFAEIVPGVDGLIHISQIADRRIGSPQEVLKEGQVVEAQIIDVDYDKKNVSLSMRALLEGTKPDAVEEIAEADSGDEVVYDTDVNKPDFEEVLEEVLAEHIVPLSEENPEVLEEVSEAAEAELEHAEIVSEASEVL